MLARPSRPGQRRPRAVAGGAIATDGASLERVVPHVIERAVCLGPLRFRDAGWNDEIAAVRAEQPGRKSDLVEHHVDGAETEPGPQARLLRAVAAPAASVGRRRETRLALPLERVDAAVTGGDLAADDRVVVEREVGPIRDVDGRGRRIASDIHDGARRAAVVAVDAAADQR